MVNEADYDLNNQNDEKAKQKCQKADEEVAKDQCANNFIEFNNVKIYCKLGDDQIDANLDSNEQADKDLLNSLFDENGNILMDQLNNIEYVLTSLTRTDGLTKFKLAKNFLNLIQTNPIVNLSNIIPIIVHLIHPTSEEENNDEKSSELFIETRKYAIDAFDELLKRNGKTEEQKVNEMLNQLRYFYSDLLKLQLNKEQNENYSSLIKNDSNLNGFMPIDLIDLTIVEHPIEAICNLMKISFDEHYRNVICKLGGIEAISELLIAEHRYHGFLLNNYDKIKQTKLKCDSIRIDEKWINSNCIALRRYTAMALTNLTFGDKQSKIQLCLDFDFLESLLAQMNCLFCEELIQVTSSVLRNLSWKSARISKTVLSELNTVAILMNCSMQVKKEATLKCILYALWNLSSHNMLNKQKICEMNGSIKHLICLLEYQSTNNTLTIVENSSGILKNISSFLIKYENLRKILRSNNCHEILLKKHLRSTSLTIVCNSVGILWNLSKDNVLDQKILINLGAISMLKNLTFSKHKIIAIASKGTLLNLLNSECLKNIDFDLESISFKAFSVDCLNSRSSTNQLLTQRKRMLIKRELKNNLQETLSSNDIELSIKNSQKITHLSNFMEEEAHEINDSVNDECKTCNNCKNRSTNNSINNSTNNFQISSNQQQVLDVSIGQCDFELYKDETFLPNNNYTIENILQGLSDLKEQNLDTILCDEFYLNTNPNDKMLSSVNSFPFFSQVDSKRSSMYSTISEPIMYYNNTDQFTFEKNLLNNEDILEEEYKKLLINNEFNFYDSSNVFHAYPVIIQESTEFQENNLFQDDDLYKEMNKPDLNRQSNDEHRDQFVSNDDKNKFKKEKNKSNNQILNLHQNRLPDTGSRIPVPVQHLKSQQSKPKQNIVKQNKSKPIQQQQTKKSTNLQDKVMNDCNSKLKNTKKDLLPVEQNKSLKSPMFNKLTKSKTMDKNLNKHSKRSLPKSLSTTFDRTYELTNEELDEINNDTVENDTIANDLTYNIEEKRHNLTYILPSSESERTLKNDTETDERTLIPDNEDEKTDKNLDELNTYVQNIANDNDLDDEATLNLNEINLSIENLNLLDDQHLDNFTELSDSIFVEKNIKNTKPPKIYDQINYSVTSSLNNSLFASNDRQLSVVKKHPNTSNDSINNLSSNSSRSSKLRSPKTRIVYENLSPPTNTFTITKSTKSNRNKLDQSKDQAMSTSGYQTSLNSSLLSNNNSMISIDKINPPSILNQISGISLNASTNDCASTCESISSINSDIYDLSENISLNSSFNSSPFKKSSIKTSTPKHMINKVVTSKIAKPVTRLVNSNVNNLNVNNSPTKSNQINYSNNQQINKSDTFRKNKMKKSNTSSISSSTTTSSKSDSTNKNKSTVKVNYNQENRRKRPISTSKSMSKISSLSTDQNKKVQSKISSLWKKTVSNQQNISTKVFQQKSTNTSDKKDRTLLQTNVQNSLIRSSTFEKLPTNNEEAIKLAPINANKNKIRPIELQKRSFYH